MSFADDFKRQADASARDLVNNTMRPAVKEFGRLIVERTPEDTGDAKGGWTASRRARRSFKEGTDADAKRPSNEAAIDATDFFAGESITWSNAAPYIWPLEKGSSDQAPNGMLAVTKAEWPSILRTAEPSDPLKEA